MRGNLGIHWRGPNGSSLARNRQNDIRRKRPAPGPGRYSSYLGSETLGKPLYHCEPCICTGERDLRWVAVMAEVQHCLWQALSASDIPGPDLTESLQPSLITLALLTFRTDKSAVAAILGTVGHEAASLVSTY